MSNNLSYTRGFPNNFLCCSAGSYACGIFFAHRERAKACVQVIPVKTREEEMSFRNENMF